MLIINSTARGRVRQRYVALLSTSYEDPSVGDLGLILRHPVLSHIHNKTKNLGLTVLDSDLSSVQI